MINYLITYVLLPHFQIGFLPSSFHPGGNRLCHYRLAQERIMTKLRAKGNGRGVQRPRKRLKFENVPVSILARMRIASMTNYSKMARIVGRQQVVSVRAAGIGSKCPGVTADCVRSRIVSAPDPICQQIASAFADSGRGADGICQCIVSTWTLTASRQCPPRHSVQADSVHQANFVFDSKIIFAGERINK